ncbi:ATP synthase subunit beta, mitochondrial [Elysia marginata]|uniref:ATP synthase subunit beta, mitochondrial n=1 Tax=Elysia marginata TaxID=1093978 RepID=A0AAV4GLH1_9GAST|nr:ATP synthase subunit beta, mitochondrial [Elysia marginata]
MSFLQQIFPLFSNFLREDDQGLSRKTEQKWDLVTALKDVENRDCKRIVIVGPDTIDKTSLVFQAAVSAASVGQNVTHICTHPLKRLPTPVHGMPTPEPNIMKNVDFLYLEESSELISWFANVHTMSRLPGLIVVEDVLTYASQLNDNLLERSLARLCATIADSTRWIESQSGVESCCVILTAPARAIALSHVLSQFSFKVAEYLGPNKNSSVSELCFKEGSNTIIAKFKRHKDSLMLTEVNASKADNLNLLQS